MGYTGGPEAMEMDLIVPWVQRRVSIAAADRFRF
jgi:hypothetical protein